ncbi:hypothetical protein IscW_ISCW007071 [Ixodes scapularis]|uniref:Uncharacterized protein n=1 Tax=Ixodes scapularis TaxID=6945 RepID=B7PRP0_IXOSC|nr:hypothetical protein IscW_ISCW007071 [Ixodes scapularis]|eukprot:XP_002400540.1 hypothetical protein IscW_ISCW007071 [Ixodes scapularis]
MAYFGHELALVQRTRSFFFALVLFRSYLFRIWLIISVTPRLVPRIARPKREDKTKQTLGASNNASGKQ